MIIDIKDCPNINNDETVIYIQGYQPHIDTVMVDIDTLYMPNIMEFEFDTLRLFTKPFKEEIIYPEPIPKILNI